MIRVQNLCTMNYALFIIKPGSCIFCIRQQLDVDRIRLFLQPNGNWRLYACAKLFCSLIKMHDN